MEKALAKTQKIYWTASNNNSFLDGHRSANTMRTAVRNARRYLDSELYGEGNISYYDDLSYDMPIRVDSKTMFTNYKWKTNYPR